MLAMQYTIALPADYDMAVIRARIASKGHLFDGAPQLAFKAFAYATRGRAVDPDTDNLYAPFYLWDGADGMNRFLTGPGFAALCRDFGRPRVQLWSVLASERTPAVAATRWATRDTVAVPRTADLAALANEARAEVADAIAGGATAAIAAIDPGGWTRVRFCLWPDAPGPADRPGRPALVDRAGVSGERQLYEAGYVALPHDARR